MRLPNGENAVVPRAKLVDYLLSPTHPVGRHKATVFRRFGFGEQEADALEDGLLQLARSGDISETVGSAHGVKYVLYGPVRAPDGAVVRVRTVWIVEAGDDRPRLVTALPVS